MNIPVTTTTPTLLAPILAKIGSTVRTRMCRPSAPRIALRLNAAQSPRASRRSAMNVRSLPRAGCSSVTIRGILPPGPTVGYIGFGRGLLDASRSMIGGKRPTPPARPAQASLSDQRAGTDGFAILPLDPQPSARIPGEAGEIWLSRPTIVIDDLLYWNDCGWFGRARNWTVD